MGLFKCLVSKTSSNYYTGVDLGTTTTTVWTLINTPIVAGSLSGQILLRGTPIQYFAVDFAGVFTFVNIGNPSAYAIAGSINLGLGKVTLTWNRPPATNNGIVSYVGLPVFRYVTMKTYSASCPPPFNPLCNSFSKAYVAAVSVCNENL